MCNVLHFCGKWKMNTSLSMVSVSITWNGKTFSTVKCVPCSCEKPQKMVLYLLVWFQQKWLKTLSPHKIKPIFIFCGKCSKWYPICKVLFFFYKRYAKFYLEPRFPSILFSKIFFGKLKQLKKKELKATQQYGLDCCAGHYITVSPLISTEYRS